LRDQLPSESEQLILDLAGTDVLEIGLMAADFRRRPKGRDEEALVPHGERHRPLTTCEHDPRDGDLLLSLHRFVDDPKRFLGDGAVGCQVVGRVEIDRVDLALVDKPLDRQRVARLDLDLSRSAGSMMMYWSFSYS
jgi:hypothetical protein